MTDVQLFGLDAGWHHRVNVLFHLANTVLLFLVLWRMTGGLWQSAFVAALFAVHPLHVESVAWGISGSLSGWRWRRPVLWASGGAVVVALSIAAWIQAGTWRDNVTLYSHAVAVTEKNWVALTNLGAAYEESGKPQEAVISYQKALRIKPGYAPAIYNLGVASGKLGRVQESIGYYREVLRIDPMYVNAWYNLGLASAKQGQLQEAIGHLQESIRMDPNYAKAWYFQGMIYGEIGESGNAAACYREAERLGGQDRLR